MASAFNGALAPMSHPLLRAFWTLLALWSLACGVQAQTSALPLDEGWQYRWGDSPFTSKGKPVWSQDPPDSDAWQSIDFPSNPPDRNGQTNVWYRVNLPENTWWEPIIYIYSVDLITEVYLDGEKIYQYGTFDDQGQGSFEGWPWHIIPLPEAFDGKPVYFRVYSSYSDIGLWGEVKINSRQDQVLTLLVGSADALIASAFSLLIALLALFFAVIEAQRRTFASIGLFSLASGLMVIAESPASLLLGYHPVAWDYIAASAYFTLPIAIGLLLEQWLPSSRTRFIRYIWQVHLLYLVAALGMSFAGVIILPSAFYVFDHILLFTLTAFFVLVVPNIRTVNGEQQAIIATFAIYAILLVTDIAVAHGYVPWSQTPLSWGGLAFSVAISLISLRQYHKTREELHELNSMLEKRVDERTRQLETMAEQERLRTTILSYEHEKTILLNDMVARLHSCQNLQQGFDALAGDFPAYAKPMNGALYSRDDEKSGLELLTHWGHYTIDLPDIWPLKPSVNKPISNHGEMERASTDINGLLFWAFPIHVENIDRGSSVLGMLIIGLPEPIAAGEIRSGKQQLFQTILQSMEKVGVVLSSLVLRENLQTMSYEDSLTGLKNRRSFNELFARESAIALRTSAPLSFIMIDLDHFKGFNDRYGHQAGDEALRLVADTMRSRFRETDVVCRYGGEEFAVILPGATSGDAETLARQILLAVQNLSVFHQNRDLGQLTLSAGIANWPEHCTDPSELLNLADNALYRAKESGRNKACLPTPASSENL